MGKGGLDGYNSGTVGVFLVGRVLFCSGVFSFNLLFGGSVNS